MLPLWVPLPGKGEDGLLRWRSLRPRPALDAIELRAVLPVALLLAVGHVTSTLAPAYGTVAFSNIIKCAEPLFTCVFSLLLYKTAFPLGAYASLLLVVIGVALVSARDLNFSSFSLGAGAQRARGITRPDERRRARVGAWRVACARLHVWRARRASIPPPHGGSTR